MRVETDYLPLIRINAPEIFQDPAFIAWLNRKDELAVATWHKAGEEPNEFSDVFMVVDGPNDGSEYGMLPDHIWDKIYKICKEHVPLRYGEAHCFVWLTNCEE